MTNDAADEPGLAEVIGWTAPPRTGSSGQEGDTDEL